MSGAGALWGLIVGAGIVLAVAGYLARRPARLADRLVRGTSAPTTVRGPVGALIDVTQPLLDVVARFAGRERDGDASLARQLSRAGRPVDVTRYRIEQVVWAVGGVIAGVVLLAVIAARGQAPAPVLSLVLLAVFGFLGVLLHGRRLASDIRRRGRHMSEQLPTAAELLAFAVSAGESPVAALDRVSTHLRGELADALADVVREVRGGQPLVGALRGLADSSPSLDVTRFVDGIAIATERGTPMAEVLRAQAADARAAARRQLLESAGRKEILMLVPVVFFILPIVVIIALFPGIHGLNITVS
ncbi:MAG: type II secretion system F family protein [Actinomycetota bacterium]